MNASFSTFLMGVWHSHSDHSLSRLNHHPLFDPQLLGLIYQFVAPMTLEKVTMLHINTDNQCVHEGVLYMDFQGNQLPGIRVANGERMVIPFEFDSSRMHPNGFIFHEAAQEWIVFVHHHHQDRTSAEVFAKDGRFKRSLYSSWLPSVVGQPQIHTPSQQVLFSNRYCLYGIHLETGQLTSTSHGEFHWWQAHPTEHAVFLHEMQDQSLSKWTIPSGECLFRISLGGNPVLMWSLRYQSIFQWEYSSPAHSLRRRSPDDGELQEMEDDYEWPVDEGSFEAADGYVYFNCFDVDQNNGEAFTGVYRYTFQPLFGQS